jgi:8-oxo-dGTP pyrophosphatase MutT (NUDIX family)
MTGFSLAHALQAYTPAAAHEIEAKRLMLQLLQDYPDRCFDRSLIPPGHFTASCWLINKDGSKALMTHHAFLNRWLQLGGHADGNPDLLAEALREAAEESGLSGIRPVTTTLFDLDVHPIPANPAKNEDEHLHYDVRFLLVTDQDDFAKSDESHDVGWFTADELRALNLEQSVTRMIDKWQAWRTANPLPFAGKN